MRSASLPMYPFPEAATATAAFWDALRVRLTAAGLDIKDVVFEHEPACAPEGVGPEVLFTQICGFPLLKVFREQAAVLATPSFSFEGCEGPSHRAFFIVRAKDPARRLDDLRGRVFGCNSRLSNTGMNLPRLALARIAGGRPFFGEVVMTGAHLASLDLLAREKIDLCAVDCVTWGLFRKFRPAEAARYRVLAQTAPSPSLPFVTSRTTDAPTVAALRNALDGVIADPANARVCETLGLTGVAMLNVSAYALLKYYEKAAGDMGYPNLE